MTKRVKDAAQATALAVEAAEMINLKKMTSQEEAQTKRALER